MFLQIDDIRLPGATATNIEQSSRLVKNDKKTKALYYEKVVKYRNSLAAEFLTSSMVSEVAGTSIDGNEIPNIWGANNLNESYVSPTQIYRALEYSLHRDRPQIVLWDDFGTKLFESPRSGDIADDDHGPFIEDVVLQDITHGSITVSFTVKSFQQICPIGTTPPMILDNSWDTTAEYDRVGALTRTITGSIVASTRRALNMNDFKDQALPPMLAGCIREDFQYILQGDNKLAYRFRDRQVAELPPSGVEKWSGSFTEKYSKGKSLSSLNMELEGSPNREPLDLLEVALKIADVMLVKDNKGIVQEASIERVFGDKNIVRLTADALRVPASAKSSKWGEIGKQIGKSIPIVELFVKDKDKLTGYGFSPASIGLQFQKFRQFQISNAKQYNPGTHGDYPLVDFVHMKLTDQCGTPGRPGQTTGSSGGGGRAASMKDRLISTDSGRASAGVSGESVSVIKGTAPTFTLTTGDASAVEIFNPHVLWIGKTKYIKNEMRLVLPISPQKDRGDYSGKFLAEKTGSPEIIDVAEPVWFRIIAWTAERWVGDPKRVLPTIPDPTEGVDPKKFKLLKVKMVGSAADLIDNLTHSSVKVGGIYYYACVEPPTKLELMDNPTHVLERPIIEEKFMVKGIV